ncbi:odaE [Salmonella enterica]|nr:odaE [Salmonella enterica subsp. enterica serovar Typhimurium]EEB8458196.1 odaE [Salmonella enterica]ECL7522335.1 odaE [Salmonella enterica subsp. enterica serovar Typhimurium]EDN3714039.1 odaE [Salmonella enterica subsp. enterica serovar Typhimurium]EEF6236464.1 odaE [Salmonella enterica]
MPAPNGLTSKNGKKYAQVNFDQVTEKGLKPFLDALKKAGLTVENVAASNRVTKKNGLNVKTAILRFEDGQELQTEINDSGDFSGFKLNGKPIPAVHADTLSKIADSLATTVKQNAKKFSESLARKAKRVIDISSTKPAVKSNVQRLKEAKDRRDKLNKNVQTLQETVNTATKQKSDLTQRVQDAQTRLTTAKAVTAQLEDQLKKLENPDA